MPQNHGDPGTEGPGRDERWTPEAPLVSRRLDLLSLLPLVSILALVGLVAMAIWTVSHNDDLLARNKIATDALWVEQTLRFQLSLDEDMLAALALDAATGIAPATLDTRARTHIAVNPEMRSIIWYDRHGRPERELPGAGATADPDLVAQLGRLAENGVQPTRPIFGRPTATGLLTFGLVLPQDKGFVTATLSLQTMLNRHVPWWIAEHYGVRILTVEGTELAARQRVTPDDDAASHFISMDPPLHGAQVRITAYDAAPRTNSTLQLGLVLALAAFSVLALAVLWRSGKRRRAAEIRLLEETAFRRSMEESLTVGLRAKADDGRILYVNSAFCNLVGWSARELVGRKPPMPYWAPDQLEDVRERQHLQASHGEYIQSFETRFRHRDGQEIEVRVYEAPLIDAAGKHRGWMGSVIDVTEQNAATRLARAREEAMEHNARLVMLGEMATTMAHELNQPLAAVASYAAGLRNLLERDDSASSARDATVKLAVQAERAGQILKRVRDLVRRRVPDMVPVDMAELIRETTLALEAEARQRRVKLMTEIGVSPAVEGDRILLGQVLANLIRNGIEAMGEMRRGDRIWIRLASHEQRAVIEIEDQGPGVASEFESRLFESFATTKKDGMGMGLAICRSIVELHRGRLSYSRGRSGGALIRMELPAGEGERV